MEKTTNILKRSVRVILIILVIFILILLSFTMVRIVPKVLSSMANATVSVTSAFFPISDSNDGANSNQNANQNNTDTTTTAVTLDNQNSTENKNSTSFLSKFFGQDENNRNDANFVVATSSKTNNNPVQNSNPNKVNNTNTNTGNNANNSSRNYTYTQNGVADLAVEIISVGTNNNGSYISTNTFQNTDTVVVKFKVENRGTSASSAWSMKVDMPSSNSNDRTRTISSRGIPAGMAITGQAIFTSPNIGQNQIISIFVDSTNAVSESNESNNQTSATINVSQNYNNYNYNNNYNNGYYNNGYYNYNNYQNGQNLTIRLVGIGKMDSYNQFTTTNYIRTSDKIALRFEVTNNGSNTIPNWNWKATLTGPNPYSSYNNNYNNGYYYNNYYTNYNYGAGYYYNNDGSRGYTNPSQEYGIAPNQTRTYTAVFENPMYGNNNFTINIDSSNNVNETNEYDNSLTQMIFVNY